MSVGLGSCRKGATNQGGLAYGGLSNDQRPRPLWVDLESRSPLMVPRNCPLIVKGTTLGVLLSRSSQGAGIVVKVPCTVYF